MDATQTIAYAHRHGVVHRDIKPENILVGEFGATFVVDWGLAKRIRDPDELDPPVDGFLDSTPSLAANAALTRTGARLGTPAYMSPEQAMGGVHGDFVASDIFNLGATLYAVLTGRAPYDGSTLFEVTRKALVCEIIAPRSVSEWTRACCDPALEAICLKAVAARPEDRFRSAEALAADLERALADQPVECYPEPISRRAARWARNHRMLLAAVALTLVGTTFALGVGGWLVERQRQRADANFRRAHQAVSDSFVTISNETLLQEEEFQSLRGQLLGSSLQFFEELLSENMRDMTIRSEMADAALKAGVLRIEMGQREQGLKLLSRALELIREMRREDPAVALTERHAYCLRRLATAEAEQDESAARPRLIQARDMLRRALTDATHATRESLRLELAEILLAYSQYADHLGDLAAAGESLDQISALYAEPHTATSAAANGVLGRSLLERARRLSDAGQYRVAFHVLERAIHALQRAASSDGTDAYRQLAVALAHDQTGELLVVLNRLPEAVSQFESSVRTLNQVVLQRPHVVRFRACLADVCEHLSDALDQSSQTAESVQWLEQALPPQAVRPGIMPGQFDQFAPDLECG